MSDGLKIIIGADASQALAAFKQVGAAATGLGSTISGRLTGALSKISNGLTSFGDTAAGAFDSAVSSVQKFAGAFLSGGGLGVALAVGSAALGFFMSKLEETKRIEEEAAKAAEKFAKAQHDSAIALQKQVVHVEALVGVATSDVSTKKEQEEALRELNKLIPENIGHLTKQNIKTAEGIGIIRLYTQALEDQATADLLIGQVAEIRVKKFEDYKAATVKVIALQKELREAEQAVADAREIARGTTGGGTLGTSVAISSIATAQARVDTLKGEITKTLTDFETARKEANRNIESLRAETQDAVKGALPITAPEVKEAKKKTPKTPKEAEKIIVHVEPQFDQSRWIAETDIAALNISKIFKNIGAATQHFGLATISQDLTEQAAQIISTFERVQSNIQNTSDLLVGGLAPAFEQVFNGIGRGGANAFQILGQAVKQIISKLIAAAATAALVSAILNIVAPGSGAAGGSFLGGFKALFGQLSGFKFASGGIATKATFGMFGEAGPEAVIPLSQLPRIAAMLPGNGGGSSNLNVSGILRGTDIYLSNKRAGSQLGGTFS